MDEREHGATVAHGADAARAWWRYLVAALCLVALVLGVGLVAIRVQEAPLTPTDMDGALVTPDPDARVTAAEAAAMRVETTGLRLAVPEVGLDVPVDALDAVDGIVTPPGFADAYWVRGLGVAPQDAAEGTVFVVTHSARGARAPGNYLIDVPAQTTALAPGSTIVLGDLHYQVVASTTFAKEDLAAAAAVWQDVPGRLQLITCLQPGGGRPSRSNIVITAQLVGPGSVVDADEDARVGSGGVADDAAGARGAADGAAGVHTAIDVANGAAPARVALSGAATPAFGDGGVLVMGLQGMDARAMQTVRFTADGLYPGKTVRQAARIVNDLPYPVALRYVGGDDAGPIAPYLVERLAGWTDLVLQPGQATPDFELVAGMLVEAPNAARRMTGELWWQWEVHRLADGAPATEGVRVNTGGSAATAIARPSR